MPNPPDDRFQTPRPHLEAEDDQVGRLRLTAFNGGFLASIELAPRVDCSGWGLTPEEATADAQRYVARAFAELRAARRLHRERS